MNYTLVSGKAIKICVFIILIQQSCFDNLLYPSVGPLVVNPKYNIGLFLNNGGLYRKFDKIREVLDTSYVLITFFILEIFLSVIEVCIENFIIQEILVYVFQISYV